jgi:hypothetical protein
MASPKGPRAAPAAQGDEALVEPYMRDAVHFRVAVFGAPGAAAAGDVPGGGAVGGGAGEAAGGAGEDAAGGSGRMAGGRAAGPGVLVAALPAEEEVVAAELDILDAALELEAYVCNVHVRPGAAARVAERRCRPRSARRAFFFLVFCTWALSRS